jgi:hypothetical protein
MGLLRPTRLDYLLSDLIDRSRAFQRDFAAAFWVAFGALALVVGLEVAILLGWAIVAASIGGLS